MLNPNTGEYTNSENLKVHPRMKELYKFFKYNGKVVDIEDFDKSHLNIFSRSVLKMIKNNALFLIILRTDLEKILR